MMIYDSSVIIPRFKNCAKKYLCRLLQIKTPVTTVVIRMTSRTNGTMIAILPVSHKKKARSKISY